MNPPTPLVGWQSQQGTRGKENDDHYGWFALERPDLRRTIYIALVADGVTSTDGGSQASRIAVEAVRAALSERPSRRETLSEWLANAVVHANEEILFEARRQPQWKGMSSTLVLAALAGEKLYIMHLGDSRAYLLRANRLYQLTTDHTWAQEALDAGAITAEEAEGHPGRNQLQRYLGAQQAINVARGVIAPGDGQMEEYVLVQPGDALLLCSDGLYRRLRAETIRQTIDEYTGSPQQAVEALVAAAVASGEVDDITAVLVELPNRLPAPEAPHLTAPTAYTLQTTPPLRRATTWSTLFLLGVGLVLALITLYLLLPPG